MIKPAHTLGFLLAVGAVCFALMHVVPEGGIKLGKFTLRYPTWEEFMAEDTVPRVDVQAIIRASHMTRLDTAAKAEESEADKQAREHLQKTLELRKIQFSSEDTVGLQRLRSALEGLRSNGSKLRVLHYGDSQIEGDRITSLLRREWTRIYGGEGPGMLDAVPLAPTFSINQSHSPNWSRYTAFGRRDSNISHSMYGIRGVLCRYTPPQGDTTATDTTSGWLEFRPSNRAYRSARSYHHMRLHYRAPEADFKLEVYCNDTLYSSQVINKANSEQVRTWNFTETPRKIRMVFTGKVSPDVYGISLEGNRGVVVDNIPMRGASGVIFTRMTSGHLRREYAKEPIDMIIYQYGGNTVPYIKEESQVRRYARNVRRQIQFFKSALPDATILMIGPSDMSTKSGTSYETYEAVPWVRDAFREVAAQEDVLFWDIYGAMGGYNSMPQWVEANPPLAGPDYIHFTPRGAREIGSWLVNALQREIYPEFVESESDTLLIPGVNP